MEIIALLIYKTKTQASKWFVEPSKWKKDRGVYWLEQQLSNLAACGVKHTYVLGSEPLKKSVGVKVTQIDELQFPDCDILVCVDGSQVGSLPRITCSALIASTEPALKSENTIVSELGEDGISWASSIIPRARNGAKGENKILLPKYAGIFYAARPELDLIRQANLDKPKLLLTEKINLAIERGARMKSIGWASTVLAPTIKRVRRKPSVC